mmetsp:Transcript_65584/g.77665  ORF Transcript_65584/g.77665 Transcript_65584/m.77665 type:complete len:83 (+) Transcript_65584:872-1120(+)
MKDRGTDASSLVGSGAKGGLIAPLFVFSIEPVVSKETNGLDIWKAHDVADMDAAIMNQWYACIGAIVLRDVVQRWRVILHNC